MKRPDRRLAADYIAEARKHLGTFPDLLRAETAYRKSLEADPQSMDAAIGLVELLQHLGRPQDALAVLQPFLASEPVDHRILFAAGEAYKAVGRPDRAVEIFRRAAARYPGPIASHNLAGALGDASRFREAEALARGAIAGGVDAPQTWLVLARALQGLGRLDESEAAFRQVIRRAQTDTDAWREYIQLLWMRTGNAAAALSPLDAALSARGANPRLLEVRAIALKFFGDIEGAYDTITRASELYPHDAAIRVGAAHIAIVNNRPTEGLAHAQAALAAAPNAWTKLCLCEALLACGEPARASPIVEALRHEAPNDQNIIAYQATAWRMLGDERYHALYDYAGLVSEQTLDTPPGWSRLEDYLVDLASALETAHQVFEAHPFQQSLMNGSQVSNLIDSPDPAIAAFFHAVAGPIRHRLEALGHGSDPLRSRNTLESRFEGIWSVRLQSGGGRHVGHVHPKGWLSSACYIALPEGIAGSAKREGWLKFGEPGIATSPALAPEHFIEPKLGSLALFPSYMWHGTEPFSGDGVRLSVAFDLVPA